MTEIQRIELYSYDLSFAYGTYVMSDGREIRTLASTVVRLVTQEGVEGFGETCPLGTTYLPSFAEGAQAALRLLAPQLLGVDPTNLSAVHAAMGRALAGHGYAKSAVDIACWDILGRIARQPVSALLGGRVAEGFPLYFAVPLGPPEQMARYVADRRSEGIRQFQLKLGGDPREDVARTRAVVTELGDEDIVIADANCGWEVQDAVVAARLLDPFDRVYLEQPCRTLEECLIVRGRTTLPMILDEVIVDLPSLLRAHAAGAMEAFNLKISKVGGLSKARVLRDVASELGLRVTIEDTWGGDLTTAAVAHLAASTRPESLFTVSFMNDWTNEHIAGHTPRSVAGQGAAPTGPGLGIDVDVERLGEPLFVVEAHR